VRMNSSETGTETCNRERVMKVNSPQTLESSIEEREEGETVAQMLR
jgi:hypothetical protein